MAARRSQPAKSKSTSGKKASGKSERRPTVDELHVLPLELFIQQFSESAGQLDVNAFVAQQLASLRQLALFGGTVTGDEKLRLVAGMAGALFHLLNASGEVPSTLVDALNRYCKSANLVWDVLPTPDGGRSDAKDELLACAQLVLDRDYGGSTSEVRDAWARHWEQRARTWALPEAWIHATKMLYRGRLDKLAAVGDTAIARAFDLLFLVFGVSGPWAMAPHDVRPVAESVAVKLKEAEKRARGRERAMTATDVAKAFMRGLLAKSAQVDQMYAYKERRSGRAEDGGEP